MITYPDEFFEMNDRYFVCRALDNRMGGFMIAEVARLFKENKKNYLWFVYYQFCTRRSWLYGATMIAQTIKPNIAIVTDVTHDTTTPMIEKKRRQHEMRRTSCNCVCTFCSSYHKRFDYGNSQEKENSFPKKCTEQSYRNGYRFFCVF